MGRPRSSTFYLPLAPMDAPLSLKAKLSVLPPQAANALLAPRHSPAANDEDECSRLERVLGCTSSIPRNPRVASTATSTVCEPLPLREAIVNPTCAPLEHQPNNDTEFGAEPTISEDCRQVTLEECALTGSSCADVISSKIQDPTRAPSSTTSTTTTSIVYLSEFDYAPSEPLNFMDGAELSPATASEDAPLPLPCPTIVVDQQCLDLQISTLPPLPPSPPVATFSPSSITMFQTRAVRSRFHLATRPRLPSKLSSCLSLEEEEENVEDEKMPVASGSMETGLSCELDPRAYLKPECRMPCPPPPPSLLSAIASNSVSPSTSPCSDSTIPAPAPAPRQRYRTGLPLYKRVLRRSVGNSAWEREEYLRAARSLDGCENGDEWWYDGTTSGVEFCGGGTFWECDEDEDESCEREDEEMCCDGQQQSCHGHQHQQEFGLECEEDDMVLFDQDTEMVDTVENCWESSSKTRGFREEDVEDDVFRYSPLRDEPNTSYSQPHSSNPYHSYSHHHHQQSQTLSHHHYHHSQTLQQPQPIYVQPDCGVDMFYAAAGFCDDQEEHSTTDEDEEDSPIDGNEQQQQQSSLPPPPPPLQVIPDEVGVGDDEDYFDPESEMDAGMVDDLEGMMGSIGEESPMGGIRFVQVPASPLVESFMDASGGVNGGGSDAGDEDESSSTSTSRPTSPDSQMLHPQSSPQHHYQSQSQPQQPQPPVLLAPAPKPWAFASLRNAVSSLVSIARSRSPSPLPWLRRSKSPLEEFVGMPTPGSEMLNQSGSSGDETPKSRPIEQHQHGHHDHHSHRHYRHNDSESEDGDRDGDEEYPTSITPTPGTPPKRTLSTSSLSSIVSSEGSSGVGSCTTSACGSDVDLDDEGMVGSRMGRFGSRSSSPSPVCRATTPVMVWDPSYSPSMLSPGGWKSTGYQQQQQITGSNSTPTSPLSITAPHSQSQLQLQLQMQMQLAGGRRSPMPGSWDPFDVWEVDDRF